MAGITASQWIWKDGDFIPWDEAQLHLLTTAVQFGASVFEGIRCYDTADGPAIFRLPEHIRRLQDSCAIYRMPLEHSADTIIDACKEAIRRNDLGNAYIRPMVLWGYGAPGLYPIGGSPLESYVAAWSWGTYLGEEALANGVDVCVSSWQRAHPNTFPIAAKAAGHYVNSTLVKMEAIANGFAEGICMSPAGLVSEGSGQNLFLVRDGKIFTPFLDGTCLNGITRDAVLQVARDLGIETREQQVPREALYTSDELFFTGTASEVTPIRSVDHVQVGEGKAGPITQQIQQRFLAIAKGEAEDTHGWLTRV